MKDFQSFFLMSTDDVKRYAVEVLHRFEPDEETDCATGFCTCGNCGNEIDPWDDWCRHCGARMEDV